MTHWSASDRTKQCQPEQPCHRDSSGTARCRCPVASADCSSAGRSSSCTSCSSQSTAFGSTMAPCPRFPSAEHDSRCMNQDASPESAKCCPARDRASRLRRRRAAPMPRWKGAMRSDRQAGADVSLHSSFGLRQAGVMKHLHPMVVRVHYVNAVIAVDEQSGGKAKVSESRPLLPEVIQQLSFAIEHLHDPVASFHHVQV